MRWSDEIRGLHAFFEGYFLGTLPADDLSRFADVLDPAFTIVGPDGSVADRATTIEMVRQGHAHTRDMTIECLDLELLHQGDTTLVASYVERHAWADGRENRRLATVVFAADATMPHGARWVRVHETWTLHG